MTEFFTSFTAAGGATSTDFGMKVFLYSDASAFDEYKAEVAADSTSTTLHISQSEDYSSYTMSWDCNLTTLLSGGAG